MKFLKGERDFVVSVDETDCMGRLKPSAIMQYMQDLATEHAETIGVGFQAMYAKNLIWVQTRMSVEISSYPKIGEKVRLVTYPHAPELVECMRDFYLYREDGSIAMRAVTNWCVLDVVSRRIKKPKEYFVYGQEEYNPERAIDAPARKYECPTDMEVAYESAVRYSQMDRNHHLNNTHYGDMMIDAVRDGELDGADIMAFDIAFLKELRYKDVYRVCYGTDETYRYAKAETDGATLFVSRFLTKERKEGIV